MLTQYLSEKNCTDVERVQEGTASCHVARTRANIFPPAKWLEYGTGPRANIMLPERGPIYVGTVSL